MVGRLWQSIVEQGTLYLITEGMPTYPHVSMKINTLKIKLFILKSLKTHM